jgi:hypothetical protein
MAERISWRIAGTWLEACNCNFGCPCNFDGFPTLGYCEANVGFKVDSGRHGDATLDGLAVVASTFDVNGTRSRIAVNGMNMMLEPFTNPVTGETAEVHTRLPTGFIFRDGHVCKSARNVSSTRGVEFDWTGKNAYFAPIAWSNA